MIVIERISPRCGVKRAPDFTLSEWYKGRSSIALTGRDHPMKIRRLGRDGPEVSAIGLGCMPLTTPAYGPIDPEESLATVNMAIEDLLKYTT